MSKKDENEEYSFDRILEIIGNDGRFQKRFNIIFNFFLPLIAVSAAFNIIMILAIPKHWCFVPGRENTNYSLEEWKSVTVPKKNNSEGISSFSSCKMFNISEDGQSSITDCQFGWEYDQTWYKRTVVTQEDWVCEKELHVANIFVFTKIGDCLGTCIFGQLADIIGRRPTFFITLVLLFLGRLMSVFTSRYVWIFAFAALIGNLATPSVFQVPLTISMEISTSENRAFAATSQSVGATMAICILPILFWYFKDWIPFMLATTIPCGVYFFSQKYIIESPRWLASKQKTKRCMLELGKMAKINGRPLTDEVSIILQTNKYTESTTYGFMSLFSSLALAKKTILLVCNWSAVNIIYFTLVMNVNNLSGNPFVNYFFQGLAELPASILGKYICDNIGRRWTHQIGFVCSAICSCFLFFLINNHKTASSIMAIFFKFSATMSFYGLILNTMEIFPTCVRQTGVGFCVLTSSIFGVLTPYIIYLGTTTNLKYPYAILGGLAIIATACGFFLPETLNEPLPETLEDARDRVKTEKDLNGHGETLFKKI